jgi:hypothetical protein
MRIDRLFNLLVVGGSALALMPGCSDGGGSEPAETGGGAGAESAGSAGSASGGSAGSASGGNAGSASGGVAGGDVGGAAGSAGAAQCPPDACGCACCWVTDCLDTEPCCAGWCGDCC